jgi:hypothetical protein
VSCQRHGDAEADAAGGACDEGGLAFEHGGSPLRDDLR